MTDHTKHHDREKPAKKAGPGPKEAEIAAALTAAAVTLAGSSAAFADVNAAADAVATVYTRMLALVAAAPQPSR